MMVWHVTVENLTISGLYYNQCYISAVINAGVAGCCTGLALSFPGKLIISLAMHYFIYCKRGNKQFFNLFEYIYACLAQK